MAKGKILLIHFVTILFLAANLSAQNIHEAAEKGDLARVKELVEKNPELVNARATGQYAYLKFTPLHFAAWKGHKDIVQYLIKKGTDIHAQDSDGSTPLYWAANFGHEEIVTALIQNGAEVNSKNNFGITPLHRAAFKGHTDIVKLFIEKGSEINVRNKHQGRTPLQNAIEAGHTEIVKILLDNSADVKSEDNGGKNSLFIAAENGFLEIVKLIIDKGAEINSRENLYNRNSIHIASLNGYKEIAELLISKGIEIEAADKREKTPLFYAAKYGHKSVAELLLSHGASKPKDIVENYGKSPFLDKKLKKKEAVIWYLGNCGWALKTKNYLLIFDYWQYGKIPDNPLLANGRINPEEIKNKDVFVFVTHSDYDHYDEVILTWEKLNKNITYIFGWDVGKKPEYIWMKPDESRKINDVEVFSVKMKGVEAVTYLVKVDELVLYHPGDGSSEQWIDIDKLKKISGEFDIVFLTVFGGGLITADKLQAKVMFPMHGDEQQYQAHAQAAIKRKIKTKVYYAENRGDRFFYSKGKISE
jgi:ankyrin repeat protein